MFAKANQSFESSIAAWLTVWAEMGSSSSCLYLLNGTIALLTFLRCFSVYFEYILEVPTFIVSREGSNSSALPLYRIINDPFTFQAKGSYVLTSKLVAGFERVNF